MMGRVIAAILVVGVSFRACVPYRVDAVAAAPFRAESPYVPRVTGQVIGFRLAGIEPDGDPLNQVALRTTLSSSRTIPALQLFISAYLENFKPDTTPILPDLLHPNQTAHNLGGFLQGKALITDNAGLVLYIGSFVAEAFLDNSNRAVMQLDGQGAASGGTVRLRGMFTTRKDGSLSGSFTGAVALPATALHQVTRNRTARITDARVKKIISTVPVHPAPMVGKQTKGSNLAPLHTGFGRPRAATHTTPAAVSGRHVSTWTIAAAAGAVLCFVLAALLFWRDRRQGYTAARH